MSYFVFYCELFICKSFSGLITSVRGRESYFSAIVFL